MPKEELLLILHNGTANNIIRNQEMTIIIFQDKFQVTDASYFLETKETKHARYEFKILGTTDCLQHNNLENEYRFVVLDSQKN
jgi:hypothetical protein